MFWTSLISRFTIVVSFLFLTYNVFQLTAAYGWLLDQAASYRAYVREQQIGLRLLRRFNLKVLFVLFVIYVALLFGSGFAWWVLLATLVKFAVSAWLSDLFHVRVQMGNPISLSTHRLMRFDALGNTVLLCLILAAMVVS